MNSETCNHLADVQLQCYPTKIFNKNPQSCCKPFKERYAYCPFHPCDLAIIKNICKDIVAEVLKEQNTHKFSLFDGGYGNCNVPRGTIGNISKMLGKYGDQLGQNYSGKKNDISTTVKNNIIDKKNRGDGKLNGDNAEDRKKKQTKIEDNEADIKNKKSKKGKKGDDDDADQKTKKDKKGKGKKDEDADYDTDPKNKKDKKGKGKKDEDDNGYRKSKTDKASKARKGEDEDDPKSKKDKKGKGKKDEDDNGNRKSKTDKASKARKGEDEDDPKSKKDKKGKGKKNEDDDYDTAPKNKKDKKGKDKKNVDEDDPKSKKSKKEKGKKDEDEYDPKSKKSKKEKDTKNIDDEIKKVKQGKKEKNDDEDKTKIDKNKKGKGKDKNEDENKNKKDKMAKGKNVKDDFDSDNRKNKKNENIIGIINKNTISSDKSKKFTLTKNSPQNRTESKLSSKERLLISKLRKSYCDDRLLLKPADLMKVHLEVYDIVNPFTPCNTPCCPCTFPPKCCKPLCYNSNKSWGNCNYCSCI